MTTESLKAMFASYLRVFLAAALCAFLNLGVAPLDLTAGDLKVLINAGISAALLTLINYMREGETRFGRGSKDVGMGGADVLEEGGEVQVGGGESIDPALLPRSVRRNTTD